MSIAVVKMGIRTHSTSLTFAAKRVHVGPMSDMTAVALEVEASEVDGGYSHVPENTP